MLVLLEVADDDENAKSLAIVEPLDDSCVAVS